MNSTTNQTNTSISQEQLELLNWVNFYINDVVGSFLFTFGIILNIFSFTYFQLSRSFKDTSMRHYFSVISITDSFRLTEWLFAFLVGKQLMPLNNAICRTYLFIVLTSGHISIWLLVFLSIERYIILQFPFRGKRIYTTRNSLRMLCLVIIILTAFDLPYFLPDFINRYYIDYNLHLVVCRSNSHYMKYMFVNNVLIYALIPFLLLLIFNSLLISLLARQKSQFMNIIQTGNSYQNAKRERQFKETTVLLIVVTFFLLITVSPRYIVQMVFMYIKYSGINKIAIAKCLNILEMFNFSFNFFFYIICSKTSRNELYLIVYYLFYWKWTKDSKKVKICNHPEHNMGSMHNKTIVRTYSKSFKGSSYNLSQSNATDDKTNSNIYSYFKRKSRFKIYCFLEHAAKVKTNGSSFHSALMSNNAMHNLLTDSSNSHKQSNFNLFGSQASFDSNTKRKKNSNKKNLTVERKISLTGSYGSSNKSQLINQKLSPYNNNNDDFSNHFTDLNFL